MSHRGYSGHNSGYNLGHGSRHSGRGGNNPFFSDPGFNGGPNYPDEEQDSGDRAAKFMAEHTDFLSHADTSEPPNTECPICLEGIEDHICVKITNIPGCQHLIGMKCLEELLKRNPDEKKECPLCRAQWIKEDGVWQGSEEWNDLAGGRGRGVRPSGVRSPPPSRPRPQASSHQHGPRSSMYGGTSRHPSTSSRYPSESHRPYDPMHGITGPMGGFGPSGPSYDGHRMYEQARPSRQQSRGHGDDDSDGDGGGAMASINRIWAVVDAIERERSPPASPRRQSEYHQPDPQGRHGESGRRRPFRQPTYAEYEAPREPRQPRGSSSLWDPFSGPLGQSGSRRTGGGSGHHVPRSNGGNGGRYGGY